MTDLEILLALRSLSPESRCLLFKPCKSFYYRNDPFPVLR